MEPGHRGGRANGAGWGGYNRCSVVRHRLGDYFAAIRLLPVAGDATALRLIFERLPEAGRFWKDLMITILQESEKEEETAAVALDYKGDDLPAHNSIESGTHLNDTNVEFVLLKCVPFLNLRCVPNGTSSCNIFVIHDL